jgi:kinetochore protein Nuf2
MAKIPDFDLRDIATPEPHRTRSHLSAFINLIRFIEEQEQYLASIRSRSSALVQDRERVVKATLEIQQKVSAIRCVWPLSSTSDIDTTLSAKHKELEPKCEDLRKENEDGKTKLLLLKNLHNKLTKESDQIKQEKAEQRRRKVVSLGAFTGMSFK